MEDCNCHCKYTTLSKRQVMSALLTSVGGVLIIVTAVIGYREGIFSRAIFISFVDAGVASIILGILWAIISLLRQRNKILKRSLNIEKARFCVTRIELDIQNKTSTRKKIKKMERDPDDTILPDYQQDSICGLFLDKPASQLRESCTTQEYKTSVSIESKI